MDYEEIICVHLNLKFLIFKNIENNEDCLSDNFSVHVANTENIDVDNPSKKYFIRKLHKLLKYKRKKKNEHECVLIGSITEVANFLFQHVELFIDIQKIHRNEKEEEEEEEEEEEDGGDEDEDEDEDAADTDADDNNDEEEKEEKKNKKKEKFNKRKALNKKSIKNQKNLWKSENMEDIQLINDRIYFKCLFNELITHFDFLENKKYENISNFYITDDLVLSICLKLEEHLIDKKDVERIRFGHYVNTNKYDFRYKHILEIFDINNCYFLSFNFNDYTEQFFYENDVEIRIGEMLQSVSEKVLRKNEEKDATVSYMKNGISESYKKKRSLLEKSVKDLNLECHFSLILIESVEELYHYFSINDIYITINKVRLNIDKSIFYNLDERNANWIRDVNYKQLIFNINASTNNTNISANHFLRFDLSIISILLNSLESRLNSEAPSIHNLVSISRDRFHPIENNPNYVKVFSRTSRFESSGDNRVNINMNNNPNNYNNMGEYMSMSSFSREKASKLFFEKENETGNYNIKPVIRRNSGNINPKINIRKEYDSCNFFLSVKQCHILELSNIYAEKKKKRNSFFVKIKSDLLQDDMFASPLYRFEENTIMDLENCYISNNFHLRDENDLYNIFAEKEIYFELCLKEDNELSIGKGEMQLTTIIEELMRLLKEDQQNNWNNYFKFSQNVFIFLNVFKEKYLTAECVVDIFFSLKEKEKGDYSSLTKEGEKHGTTKEKNKVFYLSKEGKEGREKLNENVTTPTISVIKKNNFENTVPSNIYEFKLWKEQEEERMKELLKRKEESLMKKYAKKHEVFEKERKSEYEMKKNELKEIMIKLKEEQLNVANQNNILKIKENQLNEEIHSLEHKLKQIKHAYEKSLYAFKENLRKTNLDESIVKENNELKKKYKLILGERNQLKKENEEMNNILKKYNSKDNIIISNNYFEKLKEELKRLKEYKTNMSIMKKIKDDYREGEKKGEEENFITNEKIQQFLKIVHNNRMKYKKYIIDIILHLEEIYDLTNDKALENNFQIVLKEINTMKTLINKELKEEKDIAELCVHLSTYGKEIDSEQEEKYNDNLENINSIVKQKEHCLSFHKKSSISQDATKERGSFRRNEKKESVNQFDKKMPTEKIEKNNLSRFNKIDSNGKRTSLLHNEKVEENLKKKKEQNARIIENLRSEIKRLVQSGMYSEDDVIIKRMKQKFVALLK